MDIKDELNLMLNNLKGNDSETAAKNVSKAETPVSSSRNKGTGGIYDNMSIDELIKAVSSMNKSLESQNEPPKESDKADNILQEVEQKSAKYETEVSAETIISRQESPSMPEQKVSNVTIRPTETYIGKEAGIDESTRKPTKKIVINHELPDYEKLREEEKESELVEESAEEAEESISETAEISDISEENEEIHKEHKTGLFSKLKNVFGNKSAVETEETKETETENKQEETSPVFETEEVTEIPENEAEVSESEIKTDIETATESETATDNQPESEPETDGVSKVISRIEQQTEQAIEELSQEKEDKTEPEADTAKKVSEDDKSEETAEEKGSLIKTLGKILDEDTEELAEAKKEVTEADEETAEVMAKGGIKKKLYFAAGVVFFAFAVIGIISTVGYGIMYARSFTSGESKQAEFVEAIYPAVIMDIESFENGNELSSQQVVTAAIWKLIMSGDIEKYQKTIDMITVPAVDVEAVAAKLFNTSFSDLEHQTVGAGDSKFYYDAAAKSYNIPIKPILFSYKPKITALSKSGDIYTIEVEYLQEQPAWMEGKEKFDSGVSKVVKYKIQDNGDDYSILSMQIIKVNQVN